MILTNCTVRNRNANKCQEKVKLEYVTKSSTCFKLKLAFDQAVFKHCSRLIHISKSLLLQKSGSDEY